MAGCFSNVRRPSHTENIRPSKIGLFCCNKQINNRLRSKHDPLLELLDIKLEISQIIDPDIVDKVKDLLKEAGSKLKLKVMKEKYLEN